MPGGVTALALFGAPASGVVFGGGGANAVLALREAERSLPRSLAALEREPATARAFAAFERAVARADSPKALLEDPQARRFLAMALGVPEAAETPALFIRAMLSDPSQPDSLVSRLADRRLSAAAATLKFASQGLASVRDSEIVATLKRGWVRATQFERLRTRDPALVDALVFKEQANAAANSTYAVLGHPILRRVVTTVLGLPMELAVQSVEAQARAINQRLDVSRLSDPRFVQRFAERYLARAQGATDPAIAVPQLRLVGPALEPGRFSLVL